MFIRNDLSLDTEKVLNWLIIEGGVYTSASNSSFGVTGNGKLIKKTDGVSRVCYISVKKMFKGYFPRKRIQENVHCAQYMQNYAVKKFINK